MEIRNYFTHKSKSHQNDIELEKVESTGVVRVLKNYGILLAYIRLDEKHLGITFLSDNVLWLTGEFEPYFIFEMEYIRDADVAEINDVLNYLISNYYSAVSPALDLAIADFPISGYFDFVEESY